MSVQQIFGVAVRAIGVYWVAHGLGTLGFGFFPAQGYSTWSYVLGVASEMLVGVVLMLKADRVVRLCYTTYDEYGYPAETRGE